MRTKLGPHVISGTADAVNLVMAGSPVVKLFDLGLAHQLLEINPALIIVGRVYSAYDAQSQKSKGMSPKDAAEQFVNDQRIQYERNPDISIWEGHNEPSWGGPDDPAAVAGMAWYAEFEIERIRLMKALDLRCSIGNFSTGYPEVPQNNGSLWSAFLPALREGAASNAILGLHEYSSPWIWWMTGKYQTQPTPDNDEGWTTLRYRKVYRQVLQPNNLHLPIFISEAGLDRVSPLPAGAPGGNWRDMSGWWNADNSKDGRVPFDADPGTYYARQLAWYDGELKKDDYVLGAVVFTVGNNSDQWKGYDIAGTSVTKNLVEYFNVGDDVDPLPDPEPEPEEPPIPTGVNLLRNPDLFSGGIHLYPDPTVDNIRIPNEWILSFQRGKNPPVEGQGGDWLPPESQFRSRGDVPGTEALPPVEWPLYLVDGIRTVYHVFKKYGIQWWSLTQITPDFPKGKYRFRVKFYPDIYTGNHNFNYDEKNNKPMDGLSGEWRIIRTGKQADASNAAYLNGETTPGTMKAEPFDASRKYFGRYIILSETFDHPGGTLEVGLEFRARWGIENVGVFVAWVELVKAVEGEPEPDPTTPIDLYRIDRAVDEMTKSWSDFANLANRVNEAIINLHEKLVEVDKALEELKDANSID